MSGRLIRTFIPCIVTTAAAVGPAAAAQAPAPPAGRDSVVALYCAAWGAAAPAERDRLLERVWAPDGTYADPAPRHADGRPALSALIGRVLKPIPGAHLRCGPLQANGDAVLFAWVALGADGTELARGTDFGEFAADGRIRRIVGFAGTAPTVIP